jgi:hypothetical protein
MGAITRVLAPVWIIIIGALMIIPGPRGPIVECIACGLMLTRILGVVSIVLGGAAIMGGRAAGR